MNNKAFKKSFGKNQKIKKLNKTPHFSSESCRAP